MYKNIVLKYMTVKYLMIFNDLNICKLENEYEPCAYLDVIRSPSIRSIFTKLRISQSKLNAHQFNREDVNCSVCGIREDTRHLLFECQMMKLVNIRTSYHSRMVQVCDKYLHMSSEEKMRHVLNLTFKNPMAINTTCKFVTDMYQARFS
jgi:hypothetical protein